MATDLKRIEGPLDGLAGFVADIEEPDSTTEMADAGKILAVALVDPATNQPIGMGTGASSLSVQGAAADNAAAVGNPLRAGAVYNLTLQAYATGDIADLQADIAGRLSVGGKTADNAPYVNGDPVFTGGIARTSLVSYTSGDVAGLNMNLRGGLCIEITDASGNAAGLASSNADGANLLNSLRVFNYNQVLNAAGNNWDRQRRVLNTTVNQSPATTNGAYSAGDVIGGKLTFAAISGTAESGEIDGVTVNCKSDQSTAAPRLDLVLFKADPTGTSLSDNDAFAVAAADFDKVLTVIPLTSWVDLGSVSTIEKAWAKKFKLVASTIYGFLVCRDAITLTSTSDISIDLRALNY